MICQYPRGPLTSSAQFNKLINHRWSVGFSAAAWETILSSTSAETVGCAGEELNHNSGSICDFARRPRASFLWFRLAMAHLQLGPYKLGKRIGKGGMGAVYAAEDCETGERVAVKSLSPHLATAEGFRERFEAEIESLKILQHEGIVRLLGYGEDGGTLFYSMELVDGPSLEEELNAARRFDWRETLDIGIQVCRALKHAHDHGVVHRDIKPANLLLANQNQIKIADFGIARLFGSTQLTTAGGVLGTADYMSPEQADGRPVTEKCDQYSLGCVMYALLAGRPPFRANTMPEMLQLQRFAEAESVRRYAPATPEHLDQLIQQLLSKDPDERFPNALVLARHMEAMRRALSRAVVESTDDTPETKPAIESGGDRTSILHPDQTIAQAGVEPTSDSIDLLVPDEVYDAPTMAVEDHPQLSSSAAEAREISKPHPPPQTRFTTVDEEAEREQRTERGIPWPVVGQLLGLGAALAVVVALGWALMRPETADELYLEITAVTDEGGDLKQVERQLDEFNERFADDPRNGELQQFRDELELRRLERKARARSRIGDPAGHPAELIYAEAAAIGPRDPTRAIAMLENLLILYGADDNGPWSSLARRQITQLRQQQRDLQKRLLPAIEERLAAAAELRERDAAGARRMYQAVIELYAGEPWAADAVNRARGALEQLALEPMRQ